MNISLDTRKPIDQLQNADFDVFPIWEFAGDEEDADDENDASDETWVRPLAASAIPLDEYSLSVAASFTTASGMAIPGFAGVSSVDGIEIEHGVLLYEGHYLFIPDADDAHERRDFVLMLRMQMAEVFPLRCELRVLAAGESALRQTEFI